MILFDEIEKAHADVFNALLQILDDGRLTDGQGRTVDFKNTIIVMTSNVGTQHIGGSGSGEPDDLILEELRRTFRPEFLNRIDEVIIFKGLGPEQLRVIVEIQLKRLERHLAARGIRVSITDRAREFLAKRGYDPAYGARPLKRAIQKLVLNPLAREVLKGRFPEGSEVQIDLQGRPGKEELGFQET